MILYPKHPDHPYNFHPKYTTIMALSQAAAKVEQAIGHGDNAVTEQDVTNPSRNREKYGDPSETMKALAWYGKNDVRVGTYSAIASCY